MFTPHILFDLFPKTIKKPPYSVKRTIGDGMFNLWILSRTGLPVSSQNQAGAYKIEIVWAGLLQICNGIMGAGKLPIL